MKITDIYESTIISKFDEYRGMRDSLGQRSSFNKQNSVFIRGKKSCHYCHFDEMHKMVMNKYAKSAT